MKFKHIVVVIIIGIYGISCTTRDVERKKIKEIQNANK
jgi:hypothetical protein